MVSDMPAPSVSSTDHAGQQGSSQHWLSSVSPKPVLDGASATQPQLSKQQDQTFVVQGCWEQKLLAELQDVTMRSAETLCEVRAVRAAFAGMTNEMMSELRAIQQHITSLACTVRQNGIRERVASQGSPVDQIATNSAEHRLETRLSSLEQMENDRLKSIEAKLDSIQEVETAKFNSIEATLQRGNANRVSRVRLTINSEESGLSRNTEVNHNLNFSQVARLSQSGRYATKRSNTEWELSDNSHGFSVAFEETDGHAKTPSFLRILRMPARRDRQFQWIQAASCLLVILNVCWMGFSTHVSLQQTLQDKEEPVYVLYGDICFLVAFIVEIVLRIWNEKRQFFLGPHVRWNVFDFIVTLVSVLEALLVNFFGNISWLRTLRIIRVVRALRIFQVFIQFPDFRFILDCILRGVRPLVTCLIVLFCCLYLVALALTQSMDARLAENPTLLSDPDLLKHYNSFESTMFSLFKVISGGASWGELLIPLEKISRWQFRLMYSLYIIIFFFGVRPGLLAVFIGYTNRMWLDDQESQKCEELQGEVITADSLKHLLIEEQSKEGTISRTKLTKILEGKGEAHLKKLGLELEAVLGLFKLLDKTETNRVSINELISGLIELKHNPANLSVVTMMYESQRILFQISALRLYTEKQFARITMDDLDVIKGRCSVMS